MAPPRAVPDAGLLVLATVRALGADHAERGQGGGDDGRHGAHRVRGAEAAAQGLQCVHVLNYPKNHEAWFDIVMNEVDGEWYEERNPVTLAPNIDIPVWLQIDQGRGWTLDGTIELYNRLNGPKKLDIGPYPPMQSRPFIEEHDKMFRWYDYWIKGIDNGIMDEPAVTVHVEGSRRYATGAQWPPKDVEHKSLYLRPRHRLSFEPEPTLPRRPDGEAGGRVSVPGGTLRPKGISERTPR
ncbi:hypothetical protein ACFXAE_24715 [Streptomyces sp. NPDC059454]|uniref:hypothetical protein n=1 Tax=Streptomyces sp. NPDC059454 TaxID=3346836 RepID=UPI0036B2DD04